MICGQPLELIAKRDVKRLCAQCGLDDEAVRAALGLIAGLEPKPGRRFVDVERNVVVPDVHRDPCRTWLQGAAQSPR